jgi:hypothetical protein
MGERNSEVTRRRATQMSILFFLLTGCWWHDRKGGDENPPDPCIDVGWSQARLTVEEVLDSAGETCVPLHVGDTVLVTAAAPCSKGLLTGQPTPNFVAPFAQYCSLEDQAAFICREEETDGGVYSGNLITVELRGDTLVVEWNSVAVDSGPRVSCSQSFRVSFATVVP